MSKADFRDITRASLSRCAEQHEELSDREFGSDEALKHAAELLSQIARKSRQAELGSVARLSLQVVEAGRPNSGSPAPSTRPQFKQTVKGMQLGR